MKKFEVPEIELSMFDVQDIITTSGDEDKWDTGKEGVD